MDGTERVEFGLAENEFSRQYLEAQKRLDIDRLLKQARDEALIGVIKKFADKLDRVAVQLLKDGPFKMVYKIQENLFFGVSVNFFLQPSKSQPNTTSVIVVDPIPSEALTAQCVQQILMSISEKVKVGDKGKIILPDGWYYFTWRQQWAAGGQEGPEIPHSVVLQAKNWDEAREELWRHVNCGEECVFDFNVFYHEKWHDLQLVDKDG